ncbi:hypothetical protein JCM11641_008122 [Rhodosporidiobolus odoratus]
MDRLILLLLLGAVACFLRCDLQTLWHSLTSSHKPDEAPSLVVVLLSADGDKLADKISKNADRNLTRKITELVSTAEKKEKQEIMFWVVAKIGNAAAFGRSGLDERFLRRFAASRQPCSVIAPLGENKGYSKRIIQLLDLHLSLGSTSKIYLGSLHSALIAEYLTNVPQHFRNKIVLLETGDVAQTTRDLIKSKTYEHVQLVKQGEQDTMQVDESEGEKESEKQVKVEKVEQVSTYPVRGLLSAPAAPTHRHRNLTSIALAAPEPPLSLPSRPPPPSSPFPPNRPIRRSHLRHLPPYQKAL